MAEEKPYTRDFSLHGVGLRAYQEMQKFWSDKDIPHSGKAYYRVEEPLIQEGNGAREYRSLVEFLLDHNNLFRINVNGQRGWQKYYKKDMNTANLQAIAEMAARNPRKGGLLQAKFKSKRAIEKGIRRDTAVIEFGEYKGNIIGFGVDVPSYLWDLFDVDTNNLRVRTHSGYKRVTRETHRFHKGLWVPDSVLRSIEERVQ